MSQLKQKTKQKAYEEGRSKERWQELYEALSRAHQTTIDSLEGELEASKQLKRDLSKEVEHWKNEARKAQEKNAAATAGRDKAEALVQRQMELVSTLEEELGTSCESGHKKKKLIQEVLGQVVKSIRKFLHDLEHMDSTAALLQEQATPMAVREQLVDLISQVPPSDMGDIKSDKEYFFNFLNSAKDILELMIAETLSSYQLAREAQQNNDALAQALHDIHVEAKPMYRHVAKNQRTQAVRALLGNQETGSPPKNRCVSFSFRIKYLFIRRLQFFKYIDEISK